VQSVKDLDSLRQFCVVLLYDDWQNGADFTVLPDMNAPAGKGSNRSKFELSPYLSFDSPLKTEIKVIAKIYTPDNLCKPAPHAATCRRSDRCSGISLFICSVIQ